jgi:allantoin racemase
MIRLLLINPNTSIGVTERLLALAQQRSGLEVVAVTAPFGAPYISTEADCAIAAHAALQAWRDARARYGAFDAVLIACFGDPGLFAVREEAGVPVLGLAQAAFAQASAHGPYGVVTGGRAWGPMLQRLAAALPEGAGLVDLETVELTGAQLAADRPRALACLTQAVARVRARQPVQVVIVGGAGLAGMASEMQTSSQVLLIDSVQAALDAVCAIAADRDGAPKTGDKPT